MDRYSVVPEESVGELNNRICNLFIMPLMLAMENHTIDPIITIIKANNRPVRQSDSVSSKWLNFSFCLNGIQFIRIYLHSIRCNQNSLLALSKKPELDFRSQQQWRGKPFASRSPEGKAAHGGKQIHLCRASVMKPTLLWSIIGANEPFFCVWVALGSSRSCRRSICFHAKCKNTNWQTSHYLRSSLTTS